MPKLKAICCAESANDANACPGAANAPVLAAGDNDPVANCCVVPLP